MDDDKREDEKKSLDDAKDKGDPKGIDDEVEGEDGGEGYDDSDSDSYQSYTSDEDGGHDSDEEEEEVIQHLVDEMKEVMETNKLLRNEIVNLNSKVAQDTTESKKPQIPLPRPDQSQHEFVAAILASRTEQEIVASIVASRNHATKNNQKQG
jgi:hypothetical protein